jgi:hypothetical protein
MFRILGINLDNVRVLTNKPSHVVRRKS